MVGEREDVDVGDDAPQRGVIVPGGQRRRLGDARVSQERILRVPGAGGECQRAASAGVEEEEFFFQKTDLSPGSKQPA